MTPEAILLNISAKAIFDICKIGHSGVKALFISFRYPYKLVSEVEFRPWLIWATAFGLEEGSHLLWPDPRSIETGSPDSKKIVDHLNENGFVSCAGACSNQEVLPILSRTRHWWLKNLFLLHLQKKMRTPFRAMQVSQQSPYDYTCVFPGRCPQYAKLQPARMN